MDKKIQVGDMFALAFGFIHTKTYKSYDWVLVTEVYEKPTTLGKCGKITNIKNGNSVEYNLNYLRNAYGFEYKGSLGTNSNMLRLLYANE